MISTYLIHLLAMKTLILSIGVLTAWLMFRFLPIRSPDLCRLIWGGVLLLGLVGAGLPVAIPVRENQTSDFRLQTSGEELQASGWSMEY